MTEKTNYLFVYGTLLTPGNEFAAYLKENCSFYREAKFKGELYDTGGYPGAVYISGSEHMVYGSILSMNDPEAALKKLDAYEGVGEDQPQPNEFVRVLIDIETAGEPIACWVYLYNLPVDGLRLIASGDYLND